MASWQFPFEAEFGVDFGLAASAAAKRKENKAMATRVDRTVTTRLLRNIREDNYIAGGEIWLNLVATMVRPPDYTVKYASQLTPIFPCIESYA